jgi:hypothetical protein
MRFGLGAILVRVSVHNHVLQPFIAVGRDKRSLNKGTHRTTLKGSERQHRRGSDLREERLREVTERKNRKKWKTMGRDVVGRLELYERMRAVAQDAQLASSGRPPSVCGVRIASRR